MDTMIQVSKVRKGDTICGPSGWVTVEKISRNATGRTVFNTDGKPFAAFSRVTKHNVWKRTTDDAGLGAAMAAADTLSKSALVEAANESPALNETH